MRLSKPSRPIGSRSLLKSRYRKGPAWPPGYLLAFIRELKAALILVSASVATCDAKIPAPPMSPRHRECGELTSVGSESRFLVCRFNLCAGLRAWRREMETQRKASGFSAHPVDHKEVYPWTVTRQIRGE